MCVSITLSGTGFILRDIKGAHDPLCTFDPIVMIALSVLFIFKLSGYSFFLSSFFSLYSYSQVLLLK